MGNAYYALRHKETGRLLSKTDFHFDMPKQIFADEYHPPCLFWGGEVLTEITRRGLSLAEYETVQVEITVGVST